jgi:hypothetical protein
MKFETEQVLMKADSIQDNTADIVSHGVEKVSQSDVESLLQDYGF